MADIDLSKYGITGAKEIVHNPSYEYLFDEMTFYAPEFHISLFYDFILGILILILAESEIIEEIVYEFLDIFVLGLAHELHV